jgi:hypothetical protein
VKVHSKKQGSTSVIEKQYLLLPIDFALKANIPPAVDRTSIISNIDFAFFINNFVGLKILWVKLILCLNLLRQFNSLVPEVL